MPANGPAIPTESTPMPLDHLGRALRREFTLPGAGTFVLRRPSPIDYTRIAARRISLIGTAVDSTDFAYGIAQAMATIDVLAVTSPPGHSWDTPLDDPIGTLYEFLSKYIEWVDSFRPSATPGTTPDQAPSAA